MKNKTDKQTTTSSCQIKQWNKQHYCKSMFTQNNTVYSRKRESNTFLTCRRTNGVCWIKRYWNAKNIDVQSWGNFLLFQKKFKMIRLLKDCSKDKNIQLVNYLRNCVASKKNSCEKAREYPTWSVWQHVFVLIRQNRFLCTLNEVKCNHVEHTSHKNWYHSSPNSGEFSRWRESATFFTYKIVYFTCSISLNIVTKKNHTPA